MQYLAEFENRTGLSCFNIEKFPKPWVVFLAIFDKKSALIGLKLVKSTQFRNVISKQDTRIKSTYIELDYVKFWWQNSFSVKNATVSKIGKWKYPKHSVQKLGIFNLIVFHIQKSREKNKHT